MKKKINEYYILGAKINELTVLRTIEIMHDWIIKNEKKYIVLTGAHGIIEMQSDIELREINNTADLVTPDGMPEVWLGKLKGCKNIEKVYASDIMEVSFKISAIRGYRHFFYGGTEGVAEKLKSVLEVKYPGIAVVGTYFPPFRPLTATEKTSVIAQINSSGADIVWCGLGCPKQDKWMKEFRPFLESQVLIGVGAGFDFLSGVKPLAPKWIQKSGFEWLYRVFSEPKRLLKRFSKVVPLFIILNILEFIKGDFFSKKKSDNNSDI